MPEETTQTSEELGKDKTEYKRLVFFTIRLVALFDFLVYSYVIFC